MRRVNIILSVQCKRLPQSFQRWNLLLGQVQLLLNKHSTPMFLIDNKNTIRLRTFRHLGGVGCWSRADLGVYGLVDAFDQIWIRTIEVMTRITRFNVHDASKMYSRPASNFPILEVWSRFLGGCCRLGRVVYFILAPAWSSDMCINI